MLTAVYPSFLWPSDEYSEEIFCHLSTELTDDYQIPTRLTTNDPISSVPDDANHVWCPQRTADPNMVKKLNHNASERDRRKMLNHLYSSLRSLLPASGQLKKLSIAATISQVIKYIPELEQQVERLSQRKEKLIISNIYNQNQHKNNKKLATKQGSTNQALISATKLTETQILIQISTMMSNDVQITCPLSDIFNLLEEQQGLSLINSSAFQSFLGRLFFTLHLQVEETCRLECEVLCEKLVSLYEKREVLFPLY